MRIVISGKMFSGKDLLGSYFVKHTTLRRVGLADALKLEYAKQEKLANDYLAAWERNNVIRKKFNNLDEYIISNIDYLKANIPGHRAKIIQLAEEAKKKNLFVWVDKVIEYNNIVVPDLRFYEAEMKRFESVGAIKVRINRPRELRVLSGDLTNENHYGECDLDKYTNWDYVVENNSNNPIDVEEKCLEIVKDIQKKYGRKIHK